MPAVHGHPLAHPADPAATATGAATTLRHRLVARWVGWTGVVVGAAAVLGAFASLTDSGAGGVLFVAWFVGLVGVVLWVLVLGVALARRRTT